MAREHLRWVVWGAIALLFIVGLVALNIMSAGLTPLISASPTAFAPPGWALEGALLAWGAISVGLALSLVAVALRDWQTLKRWIATNAVSLCGWQCQYVLDTGYYHSIHRRFVATPRPVSWRDSRPHIAPVYDLGRGWFYAVDVGRDVGKQRAFPYVEKVRRVLIHDDTHIARHFLLLVAATALRTAFVGADDPEAFLETKLGAGNLLDGSGVFFDNRQTSRHHAPRMLGVYRAQPLALMAMFYGVASLPPFALTMVLSPAHRPLACLVGWGTAMLAAFLMAAEGVAAWTLYRMLSLKPYGDTALARPRMHAVRVGVAFIVASMGIGAMPIFTIASCLLAKAHLLPTLWLAAVLVSSHVLAFVAVILLTRRSWKRN